MYTLSENILRVLYNYFWRSTKFQKIYIKVPLFDLFHLIFRQETPKIDSFVGKRIVELPVPVTGWHPFALARVQVEEIPLPKIALLAVQRRTIAQIVLVPVVAVDKVLALTHGLFVRIQDLKPSVKVNYLPGARDSILRICDDY